MSIRLYEFEASNACLVTRLGLELKQIEYQRVRLTPFLHVHALKRLGFTRRTVPALEIDGRRVQGSLEIARELDVLRPEPPLFPAEPAARRAVEAARHSARRSRRRRGDCCTPSRDARRFSGLV